MPNVVTCILKNKEGKILILKRSDKVRTYRGLWCGISGYVEKNEEPIDTAYKEINEETGLLKTDVELIKQGEKISFSDTYKGEKYNWTVFPFLFFKKNGKINIDWEHSEYRWISPSKLEGYDTVPHFLDVVSNLQK